MPANVLSEIQPQEIWSHFSAINAIPRASKKEEQIIQFMIDFGHRLGLETIKDKIGNVIIKKPATAGLLDRQTIVMQSHLDMVHQKNSDTNFNFETEGIRMRITDGWVEAEGTTLGADNGIGVATIMGLLASKDIPHPEIEALFTIDEETGMTGALELEKGLLHGQILLNLDTEDDRELTIGCAGGIDITATGSYEEVSVPSDYKSVKITIAGSTGGHSGMDIHLGRANANKLMNRLLYTVTNSCNPLIHKVDGGGLRNAIPRESVCIISIPAGELSILKSIVDAQRTILSNEYNTTDSELTLSLSEIDNPDKAGSPEHVMNMIKALYACPNGIYRMSPEIRDLVQTSNNLARVLIEQGKYQFLCLTRSSVDTEKTDLVHMITSTFELIGSEVNTSGTYPGWKPKPEAPIIKLMSETYVEMFDEKPHVNACHAGLECGIIGGKYPNMDMISLGPNIRGAHSPDEKVEIASVQKYWTYLLKVLENIPKK